MSEKKRSRRRKDEYTGPGEKAEPEKPSKEECKVAKWMKKNVRTKKTKFLSHNVEYFSSNRAIDALLKSKFAECENPLFTTREQVVEYLDIMLEHKFFHRAKKVPISIEDIRGSNNKESSTASATTASTSGSASSSSKLTKKDDKNAKKEKDTTTNDSDNKEKEKRSTDGEQAEQAGANETGSGDDANKDKKEKKKRKIRLDMHPEQVFVDGSEAYVWIYDPIPIHYWIYGLILLLGAIGICLFPLWPPILRKGVYYLSIAAAGFLVFILALTIIRLIIFTIVWALTGGKLNFWIFPNLTEDVGFFASFWPLYESDYVSEKSSKSDKRSKSKSKKQKEKDSDAEDDNATEETPLIPNKVEEIKEHDLVVDEEHKTACSNKDDDSSHSSGGYNTDEPNENDNDNENDNESSDNKYSDDSDLSGYCILETSDSPNTDEVVERESIKVKKDI